MLMKWRLHELQWDSKEQRDRSQPIACAAEKADAILIARALSEGKRVITLCDFRQHESPDIDSTWLDGKRM